jgi:hypothetical protein
VYPFITKRWSPSAAHTNDKTLLVIHSPKLLSISPERRIAIGRVLNWVGITPHIQGKLDRQRIRGGDGVERS